MSKYKNIIELSSCDALKYFMQPENYASFDKPEYIDFEPILKFVQETIGKKDMSSWVITNKQLVAQKQQNITNHANEVVSNNKPINPSSFENNNHIILLNKDGKYAYRPITLANPFLYYYLAREITRENNWLYIKDRFAKFKQDTISVSSIPIVIDDENISTIGANINNWWQEIEEQSIELSLKYKYMLITDISNFYPSIYTHTIAWALHDKETAKVDRNDHLIGNLIDKIIRDMQYGQTSGVPQGSTLFDFIAEMVLGYADMQLYKMIERHNIDDYHILRYRDDYRIFCNKREDADHIMSLLCQVLADLSLQTNSAKTKLSTNIVIDSIKPDKFFYIANTPIYHMINNVKVSQFDSAQKELYYILSITQQFPNTGIVKTLLSNFYHRIIVSNPPKSQTKTLIALIVSIISISPNSYQQGIAVISCLLQEMDDEKYDILRDIHTKLNTIPNIGMIELWIQRLVIKLPPKRMNITFQEPLCQLINGDMSVMLWNVEWIKESFYKDFPLNTILNTDVLGKTKEVIEPSEVDVFKHYET